VASDNHDSTRLTSVNKHRKNGGDRGSTHLLEKKQEELSRDQTSTVIAFITLELTAR